MSNLTKKKAIVGRWFNAVWTQKKFDISVIDELASQDIIMQYPLHGHLKGPKAIKNMLDRLKEAFPNLNFWVVGDLIAENDYVVGRWEGGGTHTGSEFSDLPAGSLPENSGKTIHFTGMTIFRLEGGKIIEEIGEEDALKAATQLGVISAS